MKLPAASKVLRYDAARSRDRAALARLQASGIPFDAVSFAGALMAVFDAEARPAKEDQWETPWQDSP